MTLPIIRKPALTDKHEPNTRQMLLKLYPPKTYCKLKMCRVKISFHPPSFQTLTWQPHTIECWLFTPMISEMMEGFHCSVAPVGLIPQITCLGKGQNSK